MKIAGSSHAGSVRSANQDCFYYRLIGEDTAYAIVCDGMGGANGGQVASQLAVEAIRRQLDREISSHTMLSSLPSILECAIGSANSLVYSRSQREEELKGMGTTAVVVVVLGDVACVSHVGDSRAYLYNPLENTLSRMTTDHTVVQMLLDRGEITADEAANHPQRHYITRAVGVSPSIDVAYGEYTLSQGESILLCSDGLYNELPQNQMLPLLGQCVREGSVEALVERANRNGGGDNITAVLISRLNKGETANG